MSDEPRGGCYGCLLLTCLAWLVIAGVGFGLGVWLGFWRVA